MENPNDDSKVAGSIKPAEGVEESMESNEGKVFDAGLEALKQDFPQAKEVIEKLQEQPQEPPEGSIQMDLGEAFTNIFGTLQHMVNYLDYLQGYLHAVMPKVNITTVPLRFEDFIKNNVHEKIQQKKTSRIVTLDGN